MRRSGPAEESRDRELMAFALTGASLVFLLTFLFRSALKLRPGDIPIAAAAAAATWIIATLLYRGFEKAVSRRSR